MRQRLGSGRALAAGVIVLALLAAACVEERNAPTSAERTEVTGTVKIGLIAPFSGSAASIGRNMREGIIIAVDDLNAAGGVLGNQVELVARDNEFDPAKTSEIARELIDQEGVSLIIGPPGTTSYLAIDDLVRQKKMITMPVVTGPLDEEGINPYTFRIMIPDDIQVNLLVQYAAPRFSRIAVIAEDNETGQAIAEGVEEELAALGAEPVATEFFSEDELDLTPIVLKAKQAGAEAVIIGSHIGPFAARIMAAADSLDYEPQFLGLAGLTSYTFADLAREEAVGTIFVAPPVPVLAGAQSEVQERFYEEYSSRFFPDGTKSESGADKVTGAAYLTYDAVNMWAEAAEQAGSTDPGAVAEVFNAGFDFGPAESSANVAWHYDANNHEGFQALDTWFYRWSKTPEGIEFTFLGEADELIG